jgi:NAD(P)H-flavin reductase
MVKSVKLGESVFVPRLAKLERVEPLSPKEKLFRFSFQDDYRLDHNPGQFVQVSLAGIGEAPISIASSATRGDWFELGFRITGNVTQAMFALKPGDVIGIRGPFGNGFPVPQMKGQDLLFVAGGIGLFPLRSMVQYAVDKRDQFGRLIILYGCKEPAEELFRGEVREWRRRPDINIMETVDRCPLDEAWDGSVGVITSLFPRVQIDPAKTIAMVVGPPVMYHYVIGECLKKGMRKDQILLSLERKMRCGMGLCGHCQINNVYVCQEGPVFTYEELIGLPEAGV